MVGKRARSTLPIVNTLPITARARVKAFALGSATWPRERGRPLEEPPRQLFNYLRATNLEVGLLLHFGPKAKYFRIVSTNKQSHPLNPLNPQNLFNPSS